jgi:RNA polymerase sigma factor (sigma-70 family)
LGAKKKAAARGEGKARAGGGRGRDGEAFALLVRDCWPGLVRAARRVVGDAHLAQDCAQEALVRAWRQLRTFDDSRPVRPWLTRIARNIAIDRLRHDAARCEVELVTPEEHSGHATVGEGSAAEVWSVGREDLQARAAPEPSERLWRAAMRLRETERTVFALRHARGLSLVEIAAECGVSLALAKTRLHRARLHLTQILEEDEAGEPTADQGDDGLHSEAKNGCGR